MKKRSLEEQIIGFLREADAGLAEKDLCRRHASRITAPSGSVSRRTPITSSSVHRLFIRASLYAKIYTKTHFFTGYNLSGKPRARKKNSKSSLQDVDVTKRWSMVHGSTHSRNALEAEERGEMPLTRAIDTVYASLECKKHKVSRKTVREFLLAQCERGWHHVAGPNGVREVQYYATSLTDGQKRELLRTVNWEEVPPHPPPSANQ